MKLMVSKTFLNKFGFGVDTYYHKYVYVQYGLLTHLDIEELLDVVEREFSVDVSSTEPIDVFTGEASVYKVNTKRSPLFPNDTDVGIPYIVDTEVGRLVASHPHMVGAELKELCLKAALSFARVLDRLGLFDKKDSAILHILRGGGGYMLAEALPVKPPIVSVRTEYRGDGYRIHNTERSIEVTFSDLSGLERISTLLIPDTYATGRSAEAALGKLFSSGWNPDRIILYGFIAIPALIRLGALSSDVGAELFSFAICDITQLAYNNYDMAIYGIDESLYVSTGKIKRLGSIVDNETLREILPNYVAGLDQPGDWSERHTRLFNGFGDEMGDIAGHLKKSINLIESLRAINSEMSWYNDTHNQIALKELEKLKIRLASYV